MKFTESQLEQAFIHLLQQEEMQHVLGNDLRKTQGNLVEESRETYGYIAINSHFLSYWIAVILRTILTLFSSFSNKLLWYLIKQRSKKEAICSK